MDDTFHADSTSAPDDQAPPASILIVDDVPVNLKQLAEIVRAGGYHVRPAQNGAMALKSAAAMPPDLILLDVRMPGIDGYEVCTRLKQNPDLKEIPVLFISALDETINKLKAFSAGGVDYITKPFQQEEILARVKTHLGMRRLQLSLERQAKELTLMVDELHKEVEGRAQIEEALRREQKTLRRLLQSSDHERQLIAYEIHDGLAQHLTAANMYFQSAASLRDQDPKAAADAYDIGMDMLNQGIKESRRLINGVRPPILDEEGISAAIEHLVYESQSRQTAAIEFYGDANIDRMNPILENAIYRITQESLTNACKYSKSDRVRVELRRNRNDTLRIEIRDWGIGFDPKQVREGSFGLEGIRERARLLGGHAVITSAPGKGTTVVAEFPLVLPDSVIAAT